MATEKLVDGLNAFGYAYGFGEEKIPANLEIKGEEVELTLLQMNKRDDFFSDTRDEIPATVMFRSTEVTVNLSQLRERRSKMQLFTGLQTKTYRCGRAVHTVADIDHKHIHGMRSEIEGFDRWANQFAISQQVELDSETNGFKAYTMKAQLRDAISLGSRLNVEVGSGFTIPSSARYSTTYSLHNIATLETRTDELCSWEEHRQVHRMIQDLLCLAYGYPCSLELKKVLRDDNQPKLSAEIKSSGKRVWNESKEEDFGRQRWFEPYKDFSKTQPLFSLEDTDADKLSVWIDEFEKWSRPTWIAVESMRLIQK
ncbi:hypothetical protein [Rothia amarae]|uniref:ApeA N-terminal domain 1-containing protein n=1 Tax=Rothia amarae TaxID=169480 RepID=UPI0031D2C6DA